MTNETRSDLHWGAGEESRAVDSWTDLLGYGEEGIERATYAEAFTYEAPDGRTWELIAQGSSTTAVILNGEAVELYDVDDETEGITEDEARELESVEPYSWGSEGPMMNHWYPAHLDGSELWAAAKIADLPLCVVTVDDETGLALTGGGMDLSWEIAEAFVRLGMFPPAHIRSLPRMAGLTASPERRAVVAAMIERNERHAEILTREAARLRDQLADMPESD